jgi:phage tail sheath protein FI
MPVLPTYPGVYIEEVPSGVHTIAGVSTSTAVFIGRARRGPIDKPILCLNYTDFNRNFSSDYAHSDLACSVRLFFQNGGTTCYVMRTAHGAEPSGVTLRNEGHTDNVLSVVAKSVGQIGNDIRMAVTYSGPYPESTFNLEIFRWELNAAGTLAQADREYWQALSMDPNSSRYVQDFVNQNSDLVQVDDLAAEIIALDTSRLGDGYSRSGRPLPEVDAEMRQVWQGLINGINPDTDIVNGGSYDGAVSKTYTFTITSGGTLGTDDIHVNWEDDMGGSGDFTIAATLPAIEVDGDLSITFGSGTVSAGDTFDITVTPRAYRFRINVDGLGFEEVNLSEIDISSLSGSSGDVSTIRGTINSQLRGGRSIAVRFVDGPASTFMLDISSENGDVLIEPAPANDLAAPLMLGTAQGGIEISRYAQFRPAPTGVVFKLTNSANLDNYDHLAGLAQNAFDSVSVDGTVMDLSADYAITTVAGGRMYQDAFDPSVTGHNDGVREKWGIIAARINAERNEDPTFQWRAEVWGSRLALIPLAGDIGVGSIATSAATIGDRFTTNVRYYSLGAVSGGDYHGTGTSGSDGTKPMLPEYRAAFEILDKEVDLFNLMILPRDDEHTPAETQSLWGPASVFCQKRRAFLLMDPPADWESAQDATHPSTGVNRLRVGLVNDHSAIFFPRLIIKENGLDKKIGPSGAIAGLMARIDSSRGVWKAPAGIKADLRGVTGVEYRFSDDENGVMNPRAINTIRAFSNGIINWGARTMDGDNEYGSEWKYIPIRRLALFIEESLFRGTKWVVFEPNDEPLWAKIRLNVGAFMTGLFRRGAFQGGTPRSAFFVKCDGETTIQADRDLGIVNIVVGFAPLKPAEFVIVKIQQMTGEL